MNETNYTATKWDTAEDKAKFVAHFMKFVEKGFPQHLFTKKFYQRLSNTFGHIAHYNQMGFWDVFFSNKSSKVNFLQQTMRHPCYGDPAWTYSDAEREIQKLLRGKNILTKLMQDEMQELHDQEFAEYQRLKQKFE